MAGRLKQPDCNGRDCTDGCDGPEIGTIACVSRQGNGTLYGHRKFTNQNAGDWNRRRFTRMSYDFPSVVVERRYDGTVCADGAICETYYIPGRPTLFDPATATVSQVGQYTVCGCSFELTQECNVLDTSPGTSFPYAVPSIFYDFFSGTTVTADEYRSFTSAYAGVGCTSVDFSTSRIRPGTTGLVQSHYLGLPDTIAAALERNGVGTGSSCKTTKGTIATISSYIGATAVTGPRSVTATIPITGLTASTDYIVTVKINRYTAGGGSYVDFVYDTIEFTSSGTTEDIEYDVPVNTDYDYEIDTSYKDIAVA